MHNLTVFDWSDLRYLLAVAREGSSLAAARALRVNQSTVHRRLVELERRLGCPLVERRPSGYRLTEYGKELQPYAERVEQAANAFRRHRECRGRGLDHGRPRNRHRTDITPKIWTSMPPLTDVRFSLVKGIYNARLA